MRLWSPDLEGNIAKYNLYKVFTKRVFLPLISIFLVENGGVSLSQIAIIASVTVITQFIVEIPSGYIADRWGHKRALVLGTFISAISVLPYVFFPGFWGGLVASAGFFSGTAFASGTNQAFIHETLLVLGRDGEYARVMGNAQSYGLIGNIFLISAVPFTYAVDPRLPFVIGFVCLFLSFLIVLSFREPEVRVEVEEEGYHRGTVAKLREIAKRFPIGRMFLVFLIAGIASSGYSNSVMFREIRFSHAGIPTETFGILLALGSLFAAIGGRYIHLLEKVSPLWFYVFDTAYLCTVLVLVGVTDNPLLLVFLFALFPAYDRTRNIVYESQIFREFPHSNRKSTMISIMTFFELVNGAWIPMVFSIAVSSVGLSAGHMLFGAAIAAILAPLILTYGLMFRHHGTLSKATS